MLFRSPETFSRFEIFWFNYKTGNFTRGGLFHKTFCIIVRIEQIFDIVREINRSGTSVLLVEQNATMALKNSSYGYVMETGRISKHGPAAELLLDSDVQAAYLGGESEHTSFRNLKSYRRKRVVGA